MLSVRFCAGSNRDGTRRPAVKMSHADCRVFAFSCVCLSMSVAVAGRSPTTFEIKSAHLPLLALRLKTTDLNALDAELDTYYGDKPDFFNDDPVALDLSLLPPQEQEDAIDYARLADLLSARHLCLMAVSAGSAEQMAAAQALGLAIASDVLGRPVAQPAAESGQPAPQQLPPGAMVLDHPVRSGQQVYARGSDLVVMAPVNAGAELIADGHIHVYSALRGRAIAGARGWAGARIFAAMMQPQLVSIAGVYQTSDEPLPTSVWGAAASVLLRSDESGDKLVFQPISS